jgi:SSS family solute:Na+ symporter
MAFLNRQAICFGAIIAVLTAMTLLKPLPQPVNLPVNPAMNLTASQGAKVFGGFVICLTLALYVIFW